MFWFMVLIVCVAAVIWAAYDKRVDRETLR